MLWSYTYKCWIKCISKKITTGSANTCNLFDIFWKKNITTGSSANFLSPDSNGQGFRLHNPTDTALQIKNWYIPTFFFFRFISLSFSASYFPFTFSFITKHQVLRLITKKFQNQKREMLVLMRFTKYRSRSLLCLLESWIMVPCPLIPIKFSIMSPLFFLFTLWFL